MSNSPTRVKQQENRFRRRLKDQLQDYSTRNKVDLVNKGKEFFDQLKKLIDHAKESIYIVTYIFGDDKTGGMIADALIRAAKRNIDVYLLVDGYASQKLSKSFRRDLSEAGVHFRYFEPLFRSRYFYLGRRLHAKVVVIDGREAIVGSMNIADKYNDLEKEAWFDMALYIKGEVANELQQVCTRYWYGRVLRGKKAKTRNTDKLEYPPGYQTPVRVRLNDWVKRKGQATHSYFQLFHNAQKTICVVCSYVLPGITLRTQLERAAARGVKIKFVLAGKSDVIVVKAAERYLYRWMLRNKMKLYEYQPTILHTKMAIADNELMTLGSYNLNNLSAYASIELNVDIRDPAFVKTVQDEIDSLIKTDCKPVDLELYTTHMFSWKQLMRWSAYQITRVAERLITKNKKKFS